MRESYRNIAVGLTTLIAIAGILVMLMLFGAMPTLTDRGYNMKILLTNAGGLTEGSRVRLSGKDIGRVGSVEFDESKPGVVIATIQIRRSVKIPKGVKVKVESQLIGSTSLLAFDATSLAGKDKPDYYPTDGSAEIVGDSSTFTGEIQSRFERLVNDFSTIAQDVKSLIEARPLDKVDANHPPNISTLVIRADKRLEELEKVITGISEWVNDKQLHEDVKTAVASVKDIGEKVSKTADSTQQLITDSGKHLETIAEKYGKVADQLTAAIGDTRKLIDQARQGEGTVGKLLNDPALYDNLNDSVKRMGLAMDDFRSLVEKIKKEGLPLH